MVIELLLASSRFFRFYTGYPVKTGSTCSSDRISDDRHASGFRSIIILGCMFLSLSACSDPSSSQLKHDLATPTNGEGTWQWAALADEDITQLVWPMVAGEFKQTTLKIARASSSSVRAMQTWVNEFHRQLKIDFPDRMQGIPVPIINLVEFAKPNAMVLPVPMCMRRATQLGDRGELQSGVVVSPDGKLLPWTGGRCVPVDLDFATIQKIAHVVAGCSLTNEGDHLQWEEDCERDHGLADAGKAEQIIYFATADQIVVTSGLLQLFPSEEVFGVLAHELAHYYRSHITMRQISPTFNFFYRDDEQVGTQRPFPDQSLNALGEKVLKLNIPHRKLHEVEGQSLPSVLVEPAQQWVRYLAHESNECAAAMSFLVEQQSQFENFPDRALRGEGVQAYLDFERLAKPCFEEELSLNRVRSGLSFDGELYRSLWREVDLKPGSLLSVIEQLNVHLQQRIADIEAPLRKAEEVGLGFYTAEQEADELSFEWLSERGVGRETIATMLLRFGEHAETREPGLLGIPVERCRQLRKRNWRTLQDERVVVPVGDYSELWHSACYRVYNFDREATGHSYQFDASRAFPELGLPVEWDLLNTSIQKARAPIWQHCPYASDPSVATVIP